MILQRIGRLRLHFLVAGFSTLLFACAALPLVAQTGTKPNIIFILADDLGIGDIGVYGQQEVQTPNLDRLAAAGVTMNNMYSGAPVCSPSRGVLLTGLHTGHTRESGNSVTLQSKDTTVAEVLKTAGYSTAMYGKWHVGNGTQSLPTNQGFDEFYGLRDGVAAWDHFSPFLERANSSSPNTVTQVPTNGGYTDDLYAQEATQYVRTQASSPEPFYVQLSFQIAHFDMEVPEIEPYAAAQAWPESRKIFASMVTRMDRRIGELLDAVDDPNGDGDFSDSIADVTLIMFASDNGTHIEGGSLRHDPEFFNSNGPYPGWKRDLYGGGIRTPFLAQWEGHIPAGSSSDHVGDFADFLPTAADLAGVESPVGLDGVSIADELVGSPDPNQAERHGFYHEFNGNWFTNGANGDLVRGSTAVPARRSWIQDDWKYVLFSNGHQELYNLADDPTESNDVAAQQPLLVTQLASSMGEEDAFDYNQTTWTGGNSFESSSSWSGGVPAGNFGVLMNGSFGAAELVDVANNRSMLGLRLRGTTGPLTLSLLPGVSFAARNGLLIGDGGRIGLLHADITTKRQIRIEGGSLAGVGSATGNVLNRGTVSPRIPDDLTLPDPPTGVDTGSIQAIRFNFVGVQNDAPLTQSTVLYEHLRVTEGLNYGPGITPASPGSVGNEFNISGYDSSTLSAAIANDDYLTFSVAPVPGIAMTLESVSFNLWRNGVNAANDYAIFTSIDGFAAGAELAQLNNIFNAGSNNDHFFTASYSGSEVVEAESLEVRLYGWNANDPIANTHVNDVQLRASFVSVPTTPLDPVGILELNGNYTQLAEGSLQIALGGTEAGTSHDLLHIAGSAQLDGTLHVTFDDGFVPEAGNRFEILTADAGITGEFADLQLPILPDDLLRLIDYTTSSITLGTTYLADFDANGLVNQVDLQLWEAGFGITGNGTHSDGDASADRNVSGVDYLIWQRQFGSARATLQRVPEPTGYTLLLLALTIVIAVRKTV